MDGRRNLKKAKHCFSETFYGRPGTSLNLTGRFQGGDLLCWLQAPCLSSGSHRELSTSRSHTPCCSSILSPTSHEVQRCLGLYLVQEGMQGINSDPKRGKSSSGLHVNHQLVQGEEQRRGQGYCSSLLAQGAKHSRDWGRLGLRWLLSPTL